MAGYCAASDVRILIETELLDDIIDELIDLSDTELDEKLGGASMSVSLKKRCSMMLTAAMIAERMPQTYSIGSIRISQGPRIENWRKKTNRIVARAIGKWDVVDPLRE